MSASCSINYRDRITLISHIYSLVILVIQYFLAESIVRLKEDASYIQLIFDMNVFNLKWDDRYLGPYNSEANIIVAKTANGFSKSEANLLNNLYDVKELEKENINKVIRCCQKQNFQWNSAIHKRAYKYFRILIGTGTIVYVIVSFWTKTDLVRLTNNTINFIPLITWVIKNERNYKKDKNMLDELKRLTLDKRYTLPTALLIEAKITEYRKSSILIPDWFYKAFRKNDEKNYKNTQDIIYNEHKTDKS